MDQPRSPDPTAPAAAKQATLNESFGQLDTYADQLRVKLPLPPPGLVDGYMRFAPWIAIIFGAIGALVLLVGLVGATFLTPLLVVLGGSAGVGYGGGVILSVIVGLAIAILELVGGYMMLQRRATGWWILAAGIVVNLLDHLLYTSLLFLIIWLLIAYIHLEVKPNYR